MLCVDVDSGAYNGEQYVAPGGKQSRRVLIFGLQLGSYHYLYPASAMGPRKDIDFL
jgi:hypothetical protein